MIIAHLTPDQLARLFTAIVLVFLGALQLATPGCFAGIGMYFRGTRATLATEQRERLARTLAARSDAEGPAEVYTRYAGIFTLAVAPVVLIPAVPYVLPYAATCLAMAIAKLLAYLQFRRATERRIAPLTRRTPWTSLPPVVVAAVTTCILGAAAFAIFPQFRIGAIVSIVSAIALSAIAWRVAVAPAILIGNDPQLEYLVDEHVRFCRATGLMTLASAPPTVLVMLAAAPLPNSDHFFGAVSMAVIAAFVVVTVVSINPMRKRIRLA